MQYSNISEGIFLSRPNRFIAQVEIEGREETVHVKNTGRCKELLIPGTKVLLTGSANPARKTAYDLVSVYKGDRLVNMDSQAPNEMAAEWVRDGGLIPGVTAVRREKVFGNSRFDLYIEAGERRIFMEVKGVTLEENGVARFPDAPTERGVKHVEELAECVKAGYEAYLLFVVQMKGVTRLEPNWQTHPAFGEALRYASLQGVRILAYDCRVFPGTVEIDSPVPVKI